MTTQPHHGHILELDAVRGLAALAVLLCHLPRGFWFGETGVDLFFVLSGFLITGIILRSIDHPKFLSTFYLRRSLRIFPIYYLAIFLAFCLNSVRNHPGETDGLPFYLLYLQNVHVYWGETTPPVNISLGHTWTLAIEEQFYLFWPFALFLLRRKAAVWLSLILLLVPFVLRASGIDRIVLFAHSDGLALGAMLAYVYLRAPLESRKGLSNFFGIMSLITFIAYWLLWFKLSAVSGYTGKKFITNNVAISLISVSYFGFIGTIVFRAGSRWFGFLRNPWLVKIGTVSYGLYLYHWILYELLDTFVEFRWKLGQPYWLDVLKLCLSFLAAFLSWRFIEKPILKLKDKFAYQPNVKA